MKKRWLILLGVFAFLVTGVLHAPADRLHAWALAGLGPGSVQFHGVDGTLSEGRVLRIGVDQRTLINDLSWRLQPAWLLLLRLSASVESNQDFELKANLSRSPFGRTRVDDMHLLGGIRDLVSVATAARLPIDGEVHLAIESAQFEQGLPVQIDGLAELDGLAWTLAKDPLLLGDFNANLTSDESGVLAQLASGEAPLELSGEARLAPDRKWELRLQLKPRPQASPELLALVRSLGDPDNGGWYHIRRDGQL